MTDIETSIDKVDVRMTELEASKVEIEGEVSAIDVRVTTLEGVKINEMILDGPAESLAKCFAGCSDCRKGYYSLYPNFAIYQCVDNTEYMFGDACDMSVTSGQFSASWCSTDFDQSCHMAWPKGDRAEASSW